MKTKNKLLALLEIAIVLCSLFLVALPAIAADGTQKVSATANTITTTSEDDYVLDIYGNANEDDTVDMRDLTYVKLIFFGKKPETELSDAKYDGKINPLDFIQIKLIIVGKEKELTVVDSWDRIVTVKKPVKRILPLSTKNAEALQILNEEDKVVGCTSPIAKDVIFYPKIAKLPSVGSVSGLDYEKIIALNPDLVLEYRRTAKLDLEKKLPYSTVFSLELRGPETIGEDVEKLGYILDKEDKAREFIDLSEGCLNQIKEKVETLSEDEKPRVYIEMSSAYTTSIPGSKGYQECILAGGRNIAADLSGSKIDPEWVIEQNPEIIVKISWWGSTVSGYEVDDPTEIATMREEIVNRPELAKVAAVKNGKVYVIAAEIWGSPHYFIGVAYQAKWFYPDLFEDLDPKAIHQEYLTRFQGGLDFDLDKQGVFVYHPEEHPDGS